MESEISLGPNIGTARKLARKLIKDAGIIGAPVSLQKILDYLKEGRNLAVMSADFGEKISGMLIVEKDKATIGFNSGENWYRRRFSIGHEIGHLLFCHPNDLFTASEKKECEANQFAAELLMPLGFLKKDFAAEKNLDVLSKKYEVSKEALCIHLMECRII
jgi:Zn-dependent peptidase ImmA (M78 family)